MPLMWAKRDDKITNAKEFNAGEIGYCQYCGAKVHRKTSTRGLVFMALCNGAEHTHPICQRLVKRKASHNLSQFDLERMLANLPQDPPEEDSDALAEETACTPPEEVFPSNANRVADGKYIHQVSIDTQDSDAEGQISDCETNDSYGRPCTSLRQLVEEDLLANLSAGSIINGKRAADVFILSRFLPDAINSKDFQKKGARIIDCCPDRFSEDKHSIHFKVCKKIDKKWYICRFILYFKSESKFREYVKKFFEKIVESDTIHWKPYENRRALIAAKWTRSKHGMVYYTRYYSSRQIYIYDKSSK